MYFVQFWLIRSCVKVRLVLLSPSIFISLTISSSRSLFKNRQIHKPSLALLLTAIYLTLDIDNDIVYYCLLYPVVIASAMKKQ